MDQSLPHHHQTAITFPRESEGTKGSTTTSRPELPRPAIFSSYTTRPHSFQLGTCQNQASSIGQTVPLPKGTTGNKKEMTALQEV